MLALGEVADQLVLGGNVKPFINFGQAVLAAKRSSESPLDWNFDTFFHYAGESRWLMVNIESEQYFIPQIELCSPDPLNPKEYLVRHEKKLFRPACPSKIGQSFYATRMDHDSEIPLVSSASSDKLVAA